MKVTTALFVAFIVLACADLRTSCAQPSKLISRGMGGGGAFYFPAIGTSAFQDMYVSSDMSGLYRSGNLGATWSLLDFRQIQGGGASGGRVQFTSEWNILYAISGKDEIPRPVKSTDGGFTWAPTASDPTSGSAWALYADPRQSTMLIVASYTTMYLSTDGGATFTQKYLDATNNGCYIAGVLFDMPNIYVGTNAGLLVSTNGGQSFTLTPTPGIPTSRAMVSFAGAVSGGATRFVCVTLGAGDVFPGVTGADHATYKAVYTLTYGAPSWIDRSAAIPGGAHPFFCAMAYNNSDIAYVAGGGSDGKPTVYKTMDGGATWTNSFLTTNNQNIITGWSGDGGDRDWSYGEYALGLCVAPNDASRAAITDLGFVHVTANGGATWNQAYLAQVDQNPAGAPTPKGKGYHSNGLENTSCWDMLWVDATTVIGSYTDIRGTRSTDAGTTWSQNFTGHNLNTMYQAVKHPQSGVVYAATSSVHDLYESTYLTDARIDGGQGRVLFSTNGGAAWQTLHDFQHPVVRVALDPLNSNRMYAAVVHSTLGGIYASDDILSGTASTWTRLTAPPRTQGHPFNVLVLNNGDILCSYSGRRDANGFTASSGVFLSTDGGSSWLDRSANPGMYYWTKDVVVDISDSSQSTWYAGVYSGWGGPSNGLGGLYRTTNRGVTWTKLAISDRVNSCTFHPLKTPELFVTTESDGLLYTYDVRQPNPVFYAVPNYPFKHPNRVVFNPFNSNEVWITSFGYGLMMGRAIAVPVELASFTAAIEDASVRLRWSTESETNNAGFCVERMLPDETAWRAIGFVQGNATTVTPRDYAFIDPSSIAPGVTRYRLAQRDVDGTVTYSPTATVEMRQPDATVVGDLYPNPTHGPSSLRLALAAPGHVTAEVFNSIGQRVSVVADDNFTAGVHSLRIDATGVKPGLYMIRVMTGTVVFAKKMIVTPR